MFLHRYPAVIKPAAGSLLLCFLTALLLILQLKVSAQTAGTISGKIIQADEMALNYASIALQTADGKLVKSTLSDSLGVFSFTAVPVGAYQVKIVSIGFQPYTSSPLRLNASARIVDMGIITLAGDSKLLQSVSITASKRLIEQYQDKTVLNVENSILAEGNTALELLKRAPGVQVADDGNISLKGRPGVLVMINGKPTYLSPQELSILLKGTNSASIARIEILNNPSAKYDAAGNAGIINIVLKKNTARGLNGSVSANAGSSRQLRYGGGMNLNYANTRLNVYGNYNYAYRGETEYLDFVRRFYNGGTIKPDPDRISYQDTKTNEPLHTQNFRAGLDYFVDSTNTIGFIINGNTGKYTHDSQTGNRLTDLQSGALVATLTNNFDKQSWENITYNINYVHKFKKAGRSFSADLDYAGNHFTSDLSLITRNINTAGGQNGMPTNRRGYIPAVTDVYAGKADYTDQLGKSIKLEAGWKSSLVQADNNLRYDTLSNTNWVEDKGSSNHFKYREEIHAGYINLHRTLGRFNVQAGLRAEYTQTEGHQITSDSLVKRRYFQLFPSVFINRKAGKDHELQFNYSRRVERPDYSDLNPFKMFRDPYLFYQGNPFLKPQLTNALQLSHTFKEKYTTAISYNRTSDVMNWLTGQIDSINTTFEMPQNLHSLVNYGISFTATTEVSNWWTGSHFANVFRNAYSGNAANGVIDNSVTSFSFSSQNNFKLGKSLGMELNGYYNSRSVYGISVEKPYYAISAGAQKSILKDKVLIKAMVNDIFQTTQYRQQTQYENIDMDTHIRPDTRMLMFSLSYRFGAQINTRAQRNTGSEDISNRVKGSN